MGEKYLVIMVGPPGSGKSTSCQVYKDSGWTYINQDSQGKAHMQLFEEAVLNGKDIVVDRMDFSRNQRDRYLSIGKKYNYSTKIVVLHESHDTCFKRCMARKDHETIKEETGARGALKLFFTQYERPLKGEADIIQFEYPPGDKPKAIICDLDGTLCDVEHRRHFVRKPFGERKDWKGFFEAMSDDKPHWWCSDLLHKFWPGTNVVFCSGRPDNYRKLTQEWLVKYGLDIGPLLMRHRNDQRQDDVVKEIILDFEILTRYTPYFMIDDRQQVVDMWRKRGYTCLQCAAGDF